MQELIDKLKAEAGLTDEQAKQAIETIKNFVVEKFPMLEGAIGNLFGSWDMLSPHWPAMMIIAACSLIGRDSATTTG